MMDCSKYNWPDFWTKSKESRHSSGLFSKQIQNRSKIKKQQFPPLVLPMGVIRISKNADCLSIISHSCVLQNSEAQLKKKSWCDLLDTLNLDSLVKNVVFCIFSTQPPLLEFFLFGVAGPIGLIKHHQKLNSKISSAF